MGVTVFLWDSNSRSWAGRTRRCDGSAVRAGKTATVRICTPTSRRCKMENPRRRLAMRIAVVGSGYVGLVTGACFADLGHEVVLVDNDEKKAAALSTAAMPIHEQFLPELLTRHRGERIKFSGDLQAATRESEVVFIAVGTPPA